MSSFIDSLPSLRESKVLDFKERVDFETDDGKTKFLDDVVAFANESGGSIVVGVRQDKKGGFHGYVPLPIQEEDKLRLKILQIIENGIAPKLRVAIEFHSVSGGTVIDIRVPSGTMKPYQNSRNGAFLIRGDARNYVLSLAEIESMKVTKDEFAVSARRLMEAQDKLVAENAILPDTGCTLHLVAIPREAFQDDRKWFDPGKMVLKSICTYNYGHGSHSQVFKGCEGGFEVRDISDFSSPCNSRLFLADNWSIHATATDPIHVGRDGRATIHEFRETFRSYVETIFEFYEKEGIQGPFFFLARLDNLRRHSKLKFFFETTNRVESRPILGEVEQIIASLDDFHDRIRGVSRYGR